MKKISIVGFTVSILALSALAQPPAPVRPGTVIVSGENPYIRLLDKEGGKPLTTASFWRIYWSPAGPGHICYLTVGEKGSPNATRIAIFDNEKLYEYLTNDILAMTSKQYTDWPFEKVGNGKVTSGGDRVHEATESCRGGKYKLDLAWHDMQGGELVDIPISSRPNNPFGLLFVRVSGKADVKLNGKAEPGTSYAGTAAYTFGETWLKK